MKIFLKNQELIKNFEITNECLEVLYDVETLKILCFYVIARSKNYFDHLSTYIKITPDLDTIQEIYPRIEVKSKTNFILEDEVSKHIALIKNNTKTESYKNFESVGFFGWNFEKEPSFDGYYYSVDGNLVCKKSNGVMNYSYEGKKVDDTKIKEWFKSNAENVIRFLRQYDFNKYMLISKKIGVRYKGYFLMHFEDEKMKNFIDANLNLCFEIKEKLKRILKI